MMLKTKHVAKKRLGQNFLIDTHMQERMVQAAQLTEDDVVVEIGPGKGAITRLIAPHVQQLYAIEKDRALISPLQDEFVKQKHVEIVEKDFLCWDLAQVPGPIKVMGNIPYNISTPILERLICFRSRITKAWLTVQMEFAQRLVAKPKTKAYGSLTCFVQYYCNPKILFKIKSGCFSPKPKVDSACMELEFKQEINPSACDEIQLFKMIQTVFTQRRKTMLNALSGIVPKQKAQDILKELGIPLQNRPETLALTDFMKIAEKI